MSLAIGTRFWGKDEAKDWPRIKTFVEAAQKLGPVFVAVNVAEDRINTLARLTASFPEVKVFGVSPWGKFVPALNAIVYAASVAGTQERLLASAEFPPTAEQLIRLGGELDDETLVVGARFAEHQFEPGKEVPIKGSTVPWNTFALWNPSLLSRTGFILMGDAPFDPSGKQAGVEEVATIAIVEKTWDTQAKLLEVPGIGGDWNMAGWNTDRLAAYQRKIASKDSRVKEQLSYLDLCWNPGTVKHLASD